MLTADDHPLIREGLSALVAAHDDIVIVGEAADGIEAIEQFEKHQPDVLLLDLQMPKMDGLEAMSIIRSKHPSARILVLTTYDTEQLASKALSLGAQGYLLKSSVRRDLIDTIRAVERGQKRVDPSVAHNLAAKSDEDVLSPREIDVLSLIAQGFSNREAGDALSIREDTVKGYVKSILSKLEAKDRAHAVAIALKRGIIRL